MTPTAEKPSKFWSRMSARPADFRCDAAALRLALFFSVTSVPPPAAFFLPSRRCPAGPLLPRQLLRSVRRPASRRSLPTGSAGDGHTRRLSPIGLRLVAADALDRCFSTASSPSFLAICNGRRGCRFQAGGGVGRFRGRAPLRLSFTTLEGGRARDRRYSAAPSWRPWTWAPFFCFLLLGHPGGKLPPPVGKVGDPCCCKTFSSIRRS